MSTTIEIVTSLVTEECCNCHMLFAVPADFERRRRRDHEIFFCPAGHRQHYSAKSEEEKLRAQLAEKEEEIRRVAMERDQEQTRAANLVKKVKKVEREAKATLVRIHAGVCPCCNRTFKALARHMATQHSDDPRAAAELERLARLKTEAA